MTGKLLIAMKAAVMAMLDGLQCAAPTLTKVHPVTKVKFFDNYPEFEAIKDVFITPTGSRKGDRAIANAIAGIEKEPPGVVWHHHQDFGRMQLVPSDSHALTGHEGGWKLWGKDPWSCFTSVAQ